MLAKHFKVPQFEIYLSQGKVKEIGETILWMFVLVIEI